MGGGPQMGPNIKHDFADSKSQRNTEGIRGAGKVDSTIRKRARIKRRIRGAEALLN